MKAAFGLSRFSRLAGRSDQQRFQVSEKDDNGHPVAMAVAKPMEKHCSPDPYFNCHIRDRGGRDGRDLG